jgi:hypothetical protein
MGDAYLPLWQRQQILAGLGVKIVRPAPPEPAPSPPIGGEPPDAGTWFTDGLAEPNTTPPWNGEVE